MLSQPRTGLEGTTSTQPTGTTTLLAENSKRIEGRLQLLSTGPFFVKRGPGASSTNFDKKLINIGDEFVFYNWTGIVTVNANPAGAINAAEFT